MNKRVFAYVLFVLAIGLSGWLMGVNYRQPSRQPVRTIVKTDTVRVNFRDTVYQYIAKKIRYKVTDTLSVRDTVYVRDTFYVVLSSPFRIGNDTLNCSGRVSLYARKRFVFTDVAFQYPKYVKYKYVYKEKTDWKITALAGAVGLVAGLIIK